MSKPYRVDPLDPRAPSMEIWRQLSAEERRQIVEALPSELELAPPEGDHHRIPKDRAMEALGGFFRKTRRDVYLSAELPVYYPDERVFAPDVIAVLDVDAHPRNRWVVADEEHGLDLAIEIAYAGSRRKDLHDNVAFYARLGIPEYFVFDRRDLTIRGYRLEAGAAAYVPIVPQHGCWASQVLGLELAVRDDRLRFQLGTAVLLEHEELLDRANGLADDLQARLDATAEQLQVEQQRVEEERQRADAAEQRVAALEEELERLRRERGEA